MGFVSGITTLLAVIVLIIVAAAIGFLAGIGLFGYLVKKACPLAWDMIQSASQKKNEDAKREETLTGIVEEWMADNDVHCEDDLYDDDFPPQKMLDLAVKLCVKVGCREEAENDFK